MELCEPRVEVARDILQRAPYGHLAWCEDGRPAVRAMNYALVDDALYLHASEKNRPPTGPVELAAEDAAVPIPSYWRHPFMACPASTYYRSVIVRGVLERVESINEKADALKAFMRRYQPEAKHLPLDDPRYAGPLRELAVWRLPLRDWSCRVKMAQHVPDTSRQAIFDGLLSRNNLRAATFVARMNPDAVVGTGYPCESRGLRWTDHQDDVDTMDAWHLLNTTYWAARRSVDLVVRNQQEASLILAAHDSDGLAVYSRTVRLDRKVCWLFDVVVREDLRGYGVGHELMERILSHPLLHDTQRVFLDTRDRMRFYSEFGFTEVARQGPSSLMVRLTQLATS
ncbi:MAG: GNAT family N-acetyltransferase [Candidatus Xenobia bacterium]